MSALKDLAYDIEQLYIEGLSPAKIAEDLGCSTSLVNDWLKQESISEGEDDAESY